MKRTSKNFTQIINIPELIVLGMNEDKEGFVFITKHLEKRCKCPKCGTLSTTVHQNKQSFVRDLPIGERPVYLLISRRQFKCKICKKPFTEQLSFLGKRKTYTTRLANFIVTEVVDSNVHSVAKRYGLTDDEVWSMVEFVGENIIPKQPPKFKKIGIDEISLVKGQGNFVVVIVDLERHKLIEIVSERKQKKIRDVMESWGEEILAGIEEVSIDMTGNYKSLIQKICPNALITVDRFHVMKVINNELNQARISQFQVAQELGIKERARLMSNLKGRKYILLKNQDNLNEKELAKLETLKEASPTLEIMHSLKEEFRAIFENAPGFGQGLLQLIDWLIKAESYYPKSVPTIYRWLEGIVGYFDYRTTSGIVEGINNKLKLIKRSAFGFRNFKNFRLIALISWQLNTNRHDYA